jgi:hypothetical protein
MPKIENKLELSGYAWFDDEGSIVWALKEELEDVPPHQRPEGCSAVIIEIYPTEEWHSKARREKEFLGDVASQVNQLTSELKALQNSMRAKG